MGMWRIPKTFWLVSTIRQLVRAFRTNAQIVPEVEFISLRTLSLRSTGPVAHGASVPAYGVAIAINALLGNHFVITPTDGVAFALNVPTNPPPAGQSQRISIKIINTFGVLGAATFTAGAGGFRIGAAWVQPANTFSRTIYFDFDQVANAWVESSRTAADVAN